MKKMSKVLVLVLAVVMLVASFAPLQAKPSEPTIVEIALSVNAQTGEFSTLIAALSSAGLVDALNGRGQFTVFAPTDAAFAALGLNAGNIGSLDTATLTDILLYHVSRGRNFSDAVLDKQRIRMMNGDFTFVTVNADGAFINDSQLLAAAGLIDIAASNGVIHVIDAVLLPPN